MTTVGSSVLATEVCATFLVDGQPSTLEGVRGGKAPDRDGFPEAGKDAGGVQPAEDCGAAPEMIVDLLVKRI